LIDDIDDNEMMSMTCVNGFELLGAWPNGTWTPTDTANSLHRIPSVTGKQ